MNYDLNDDLYYKKVMPEEIEDVYYVFVMESIVGIDAKLENNRRALFPFLLPGTKKKIVIC